MPNPTKIPIKTIQFLDISFLNRRAFLDFIQKEVIELALKNQEAFSVAACNAQYFHRDKQHKKSVEVLIHNLIKDNVFSLRAYTKPAIKSLDYWYLLFQNKYPELCKNIIVSREQFEYKTLEKSISYTSYNWIPYRDCKRIDKQYFYTKTALDGNEHSYPVDFIRQLFNNLVFGFIQQQLALDNKIKVNIDNFSINSGYKSIEALKTTKDQAPFYPKKLRFNVQFSTNVQLPSYFSLGQNPAYGNGVFIRENKKQTIKSYEKPKAKPKPNQTE